METPLIVLGCIAAVLVGLALLRRPVTEHTYYEEDCIYTDQEVYDQMYPDLPVAPATRFQPGFMYTWEQIEDLLWAYGYTRDEVRAAWKYNYIEIYRNGLRAEFDGSLFATDKHGNQLYACHQFDPNADTADSDRWRRQPTEDERRKAVYR